MIETLKSRIAVASISLSLATILPNYSYSEVPKREGTTKTNKQRATKTEKKKTGGVKFIATPPTPLESNGEPSKKPEPPNPEMEKKPAATTEAPPLPPLPDSANPENVIPNNSTNQLYDPVPNSVMTPYGPVPLPPVDLSQGKRSDESPSKWRYGIGKIIVKYEGGVGKKFPKLPAEDKLAQKSVPLLEAAGVFYHIPTVRSLDAKKAAPDPALPEFLLTEQKPTTPKVDETPIPAGKLAKEKTKAPIVAKPEVKPPAPAGSVVQFVPSEAGKARTLSASAVIDVFDAIVEQVNAVGVIGVVVQSNLDPRAGESGWKDGADLEIRISVSEVAGLRTISRRLPFRAGSVSLINDDQAEDGETVKDKKHLWIKEKSPVKAGSLIEKEKLQTYLTRLNRFIGRRVDAALNASGEPGKVILDYLIKEQKPFSVYAQTANTGTEATGIWRHRLGAEYKQLRNLDDIARFEYVTSEPSKFQSLFGSYEFAIEKPDILKGRVYGSYGTYSAQDIGFGLSAFEGENLTVGTSITWTPLYWKDFPLDITAGVEWFVVKADNEASGRAEAAFILPSLSIGTDRKTEKFTLAMDLTVQASVGGPSQTDLDGLGRVNTEGSFILSKWAIAATAYLEPLFLGKKWRDYERTENPTKKEVAEFEEQGGKARFGVDSRAFFDLKHKAEMKWKRGVRAHEVAFSTTGQYVIGDSRLSPQLMAIAGGTNTVRGYPEAFSSGDNAWTASLEYRLHLARYLAPYEVVNARKDMKMLMARPMPAAPIAPVAAKGKKGKPEAQKATPLPEVAPVKLASTKRNKGFNFRPQEAGGEPDWDFIFRMFADGAQTFNNAREVVAEVDRTMLSIGAGIEFQLYTPLYSIIRLDYGIVLAEESELLVDPVRAGDARIHLSGTIAW